MRFMPDPSQLIVIALLLVGAVVLAVVSRNNPPLRQAWRRIFAQPKFTAAFIVLAVAAVGLNGAVDFLKLHFKKEPVPLAQPLTVIPDALGPWVQVTPDKAIDHNIEDVLGTHQYIFRDYVDTRIAGRDVKERFQHVQDLADAAKDPDDRAKLQSQIDEMLWQIRARNPEAVVNLAVTYYTGMVDTVAHVPDRCYVADGYEPKPGEDTFQEWPIARDLPDSGKPKVDGRPSDDVKVRFINFEDQTGTRKVTRSVAYFFHTNGTFASSPLEVRLKLQNLRERHAYYAKVEVMTLVNNQAKSAKVLTDFLTNALPEIYKCLPDWSKVTAAEHGAKLADAASAKTISGKP